MSVQDFNKKFSLKRIRMILCGLGIIFLAIGLPWSIPRVHIILFGASAEATIVSNRFEKHADNDIHRNNVQTIYYPTVEFKDAASEKLIRKTIKKGSEFYDYIEGERATVRYLPEHPKEFLLGPTWTWLIFPGIPTIFGALFLLAGLTLRDIPGRNPPSLSNSPDR